MACYVVSLPRPLSSLYAAKYAANQSQLVRRTASTTCVPFEAPLEASLSQAVVRASRHAARSAAEAHGSLVCHHATPLVAPIRPGPQGDLWGRPVAYPLLAGPALEQRRHHHGLVGSLALACPDLGQSDRKLCEFIVEGSYGPWEVARDLPQYVLMVVVVDAPKEGLAPRQVGQARRHTPAPLCRLHQTYHGATRAISQMHALDWVAARVCRAGEMVKSWPRSASLDVLGAKRRREQDLSRDLSRRMHGLQSLVAALFLVLGSLAGLLLGHDAALRLAAPITHQGTGQATYSVSRHIGGVIHVEGALGGWRQDSIGG